MSNCGATFQAHIARFSFLNHLIKFVSSKHLKHQTPKEIQDRILDLLLIWTIEYPQEQKIKLAYSMLMDEGCKHEPPKSVQIDKNNKVTSSGKKQNTVFDNIPKELLLSKNPKDAQAANLLIEKWFEEVCISF